MIRKTKIFILCMLLAGLLILFLIPIISAYNIWINYGQEVIGMVTLTESLLDSGIALEKTGETMPGSESDSPASSSGGSSGGGSSSVTNVYNTYVTKNGEGEKENPNTNINKDSSNQISKETEEANSAGITGAVVGGFQRLLSGKQITFIIAILCGTFIIFIIVRYKTILLKKKQ